MFFKRKPTDKETDQLVISFSESVQIALEFIYAIKYEKLPESLAHAPRIDEIPLRGGIASIRGAEIIDQEWFFERDVFIRFKEETELINLYLRKNKAPNGRWRVLSVEYGNRSSGGDFLVVEPYERFGQIQSSHIIHCY